MTDLNLSVFYPPAVQAALRMIQESGLDKMRCVLTGAPYGTIDSEEIAATLIAASNGNYLIDPEILMDSWDLTLLTQCSRISPALTNRKVLTLQQIMAGQNGKARLLTFYMTRFFYSHDHKARGNSSTILVERMHFAREMYDTLIEEFSESDLDEVAKLLLQIAHCDAWLNLQEWKHLRLMNPRTKENGIATEELADFRAWTLAPMTMPVTVEALTHVAESLTRLMLATVLADGNPADIANTNLESINVAQELARVFGTGTRYIEHVKTEAEIVNEEQLEIAEFFNRVTNKTVKIAWSATHGRGFTAGSKGPMNVRKHKAESPEARKELKAAKTPKAPKEKKLGAGVKADLLAAMTLSLNKMMNGE